MSNMKRCPFCGAPNPPDATFCVNCGAKLPTNQPQPYTATPPPPPPSSLPPVQQGPGQQAPYSKPMSNTQPKPPTALPPPPPPVPPARPAQPMQPYPPGPMVVKEKEPGIAALLSLIIPGAGQIYVGKVGRGILIFIITAILAMVLVGFIIWIWNIFDAYSLAKKYNEAIMTTGTKPW